MEQGLYNYNGGDESSIDLGGGDAYAFKSALHYAQIGIEKRL